MRNQTRAMLLGRILEENSSGGIDRNGLAPLRFSQKRMRKSTATVSIDRQAKRIDFGQDGPPQPLRGGEQDRASAIWQLISMARARSESFKPGASWTFSVIGPRSVDTWTFQLIAQQTMKTAFGEIATVHIRKAPPEKARDQQIDIWLAPTLEWFPVRLHYAEEDGDTIEQTLIRISRK